MTRNYTLELDDGRRQKLTAQEIADLARMGLIRYAPHRPKHYLIDPRQTDGAALAALEVLRGEQ